MNIDPLKVDEFSIGSGRPTLARRADLSLDDAQNRKLIKHIEAGGFRTLLYGGNANLYPRRSVITHTCWSNSLTLQTLPCIRDWSDFGKMMDQARLLKGTGYRTAMVLPMQVTTPKALPLAYQVCGYSGHTRHAVHQERESWTSKLWAGWWTRGIMLSNTPSCDEPANDPPAGAD